MSYLLRAFLKNEWEKNNSKALKDFYADPITKCIKTSKNTLSVWVSSTNDFSSIEMKDLILAFASSTQQPATLDFILLDESILLSESIEIIETEGVTKFYQQNEKHRDLCNLTYEKLGIVSQHIMNQFSVKENSYRITLGKILELMADAVKGDSPKIALADLSESWQKHVQKVLNRPPKEANTTTKP